MANETLKFKDNGVQYSLNLTTTSNGSGGDEQVTAVSGTAGGATITGLDGSFNGPDNLIYSQSPYVDSTGLSFDTQNDQFNLSNPFGPNDYLRIASSGADDQVTNVTLTPACYCAGSRVLTVRGEVEVESLQIGDLVVTAAGHHRAIKWIGRRAYPARFVRGNAHLRPIRFQAGSLGPHTPSRDLCVSPKHAMHLFGALIEADLLVNGSTIAPDLLDGDVHYFHIELDSHDVLVVEGARSESFVDDSNRGMFQNAHEFAESHPEYVSSPAAYCAPRLAKDDPRLFAAKRFIAAYAARRRNSSAAWTTTSVAELKQTVWKLGYGGDGEEGRAVHPLTTAA